MTKIFFFRILILYSTLSFAQDSIVWNSKKDKIKIPFELSHNLMIVDVVFNGVKLKMIADKGSDEAYDKIAKAVIDYWMSTATKPFQPGPPIPPCMIPTPGTYIPVYYGSQKRLAANLKRALNSGKYFEYPATIQPATKVVASALAVAFATHLIELKFIYMGQIYVGVSTAPMVGFVPVVF